MNAAYPPTDGMLHLRPQRHPDAMVAGRGADRAGARRGRYAAVPVGRRGGGVRAGERARTGRRIADGRQRLRPDRGCSATSRSSAYGITTHYYDPLAGAADIQALLSKAHPRDLHGKPRLADLRGPGRARHLRARQATRCRHPARQHLGDAAVLPGARRTASTSRSSPAPNMSRAMPTDARLGHRDRAGLGATVEDLARCYGQCASPDDAFLAARGLRTLGVRLGGTRTARSRSRVGSTSSRRSRQVLHPAFKDCPGHAFWKRDFTGSTGLFSIVLKDADDAAADRFVESLAAVRHRLQLGRLRKPRAAGPPAPRRTVRRDKPAGAMVRLHIGLEDPDDLIADLAEGLKLIG